MSNPTNMEDFIKAVKEDLTDRLSDLYPGIQVEHTYVEKAQGESYEGIRLQIPGQVAAPVMNVEPFYEKVTTSVPYREVIEDMDYYDDHNTALQHGHRTWEAFISDGNGDREVEVLVSSGHEAFSATLKNNGLDYVADKLLTNDQKELYDLLVETKGNKPELFANDIYANGAIPFDYSIPGEALSDQKFAGMMAEAQKYLGYPYVWGGSTPQSSFDCSGFVCWVINHSGNGWNVGRTTANGLCNMLAKVSPEEAKPGDIIFFQGTYATAGASHVGIYLGDNMMIHCGNPIQYARTDTAYWRQHFYCFGRLPS